MRKGDAIMATTTISRKYQAEKFVASSPDAKILGQAILSLVENIPTQDIASILQKYDLAYLRPDQWYPEQSSLNLFKEVAASDAHFIENMVTVGLKLIETWPFPPEITSVSQALGILSEFASANGRNVPEGWGITIRSLGERHFLVFFNTPFPDEQLFGYLWAIVNRFKPRYHIFTVFQVPNPNPELEPGSAFEVEWGHLSSLSSTKAHKRFWKD